MGIQIMLFLLLQSYSGPIKELSLTYDSINVRILNTGITSEYIRNTNNFPYNATLLSISFNKNTGFFKDLVGDLDGFKYEGKGLAVDVTTLITFYSKGEATRIGMSRFGDFVTDDFRVYKNKKVARLIIGMRKGLKEWW